MTDQVSTVSLSRLAGRKRRVRGQPVQPVRVAGTHQRISTLLGEVGETEQAVPINECYCPRRVKR